jgi:hypothetical protein
MKLVFDKTPLAQNLKIGFKGHTSVGQVSKMPSGIAWLSLFEPLKVLLSIIP